MIYLIHINSNLSYPRYNNKKYSTEDNRLSITAETVTPTGHDITLNPNETLIVTYSCNNRGETANIELGYGLNTRSMLSFFVEISGVRQYRPASATFVYTNNTNANITLYGLTRINIDTELMYVDCNYIIIK